MIGSGCTLSPDLQAIVRERLICPRADAASTWPADPGNKVTCCWLYIAPRTVVKRIKPRGEFLVGVQSLLHGSRNLRVLRLTESQSISGWKTSQTSSSPISSPILIIIWFGWGGNL